MAAFAPLHNRVELEGIALIEKKFGPVPQVAVFDTGFHSGLSEAAAIYPGPYEWAEQGIRRFGFHGINHEYCAGRAAQLLGRDTASLKLVTCHLGNGCSLAAIHDGQSVDTTMGFTPLEGLMMGTRSGSVDPGILTYLLRDGHTNGKSLDETVEHEVRLARNFRASGDMREVVTAMHEGNQRARLAFDIFVHRLRSGIGAMIARSERCRRACLHRQESERIRPKSRAGAIAPTSHSSASASMPRKNASVQPDQDIATVASKVRVLVIRAQEDWAIARECWKLQQRGTSR